MLVIYDLKPLESSIYGAKEAKVDEIDQCPMCKTSISPVYLNGVYIKNNSNDYEIYIECHLLCTACKRSFIGSYGSDITNAGILVNIKLLSVEPKYFKEEYFDKNIKSLSPQFVKIYNQSLAAESYSLDEIAGIGYRKALEFLVKDFAIHEHPDDEAKIKSMLLGPCINVYINNEQIKVLAQRSSWIGNDETHYIRKQENRDISDMKAFIKAAVYFIGMILITEDAASMESK